MVVVVNNRRGAQGKLFTLRYLRGKHLMLRRTHFNDQRPLGLRGKLRELARAQLNDATVFLKVSNAVQRYNHSANHVGVESYSEASLDTIDTSTTRTLKYLGIRFINTAFPAVPTRLKDSPWEPRANRKGELGTVVSVLFELPSQNGVQIMTSRAAGVVKAKCFLELARPREG
jgi:hypothetical protein